jgi:hypothetical protein
MHRIVPRILIIDSTWIPGLIPVIALAGTVVSSSIGRAECRRDSHMVDTTGATTHVPAMWGAAPGTTFIARDTVISAITVWRIPNQAVNRSDMKLWIVEVDSTGRPQNHRVVFEGPTLRAPPGDGMNATPTRFELNPPAILPYRGKFAFMVQNLCEWFFGLLVRDGATYPEGELWRSETSNYYGCVLWGIYDRFDEYDLACKIEYCSDTVTPVTRRSWGQLKVIYR